MAHRNDSWAIRGLIPVGSWLIGCGAQNCGAVLHPMLLSESRPGIAALRAANTS